MRGLFYNNVILLHNIPKMVSLKKTVFVIFFMVCCTHSFAQQNTKVEAAQKVLSKITEKNSYVDDLLKALSTRVSLPVGVKRTISNNEVVIAIDKVKFRKDYTEFSAFVRITTSLKSKGGEDVVLFFGANGLKITNEGSIIGEANVSLLQDIEIPFNKNASITLKGHYDGGNSNSKTYVSLDCNGFKELGIDADVVFSKKMIRGFNAKDSTVRANFRTVVGSFNDIVANITLPRFEIVGLDGFEFEVNNVSLDFSDLRNDPSVSYPSGYVQNYMIPGNENLWRGVYARNISVTLPQQFASKGNAKRTSFQAENMLIDENGITGLFSANNILSFGDGDASGWSFSVEGFKMELEANRIKGAGFDGQIGLPFKTGDKTTKLDYTAFIGAGNKYVMKVQPADTLDFSIFNAKAQILPNSYILMNLDNGRFKPEAMLHGSMSISTKGDNNSDIDTHIPSLEFRSLHLTTDAPYINVEYFGYKGEVSFGSFPVSLRDIELKTTNGNAVLSAGVDVTLADDMFSGQTKLALLSSLKGDGGSKYWHFDGVRVDEIGIEATIAEIIKLKGKVGWRRDDPVYGNGFYGDLNMNINLAADKSLGVGVSGCFGIIDGMRYWYVDGSVILPPPGIGVGVVGIRGFAGAVAYRMTPSGGGGYSGTGSFAKTTYTPDKDASLSLKAAVKLTMGDIANGEASFEIAFSNSGGLSYVGFYGYAEVATKIKMPGLDKLNEAYNKVIENEKKFLTKHSNSKIIKQFKPNEAAKELYPMPKELQIGIYGSLGIQYDFKNRSLHANSEIYISTPLNIITGDGQNGKAGWFTLHVDPSDWYFHMGRPDDRIGLKVGIAGLYVRSDGYIMTGSHIPDMPAPPKQVADILGMDLSKLTLNRNIESLSTGKGFALGFDFEMDTGNINFLILYARFMAGLGFDLMFKDYGQMQCAETGSQIGLNGWFAQGQAYVYLQGELGVNINLGFIKRRIPVIKGGAAALLQAMFPNPSAFNGYLGVYVDLLGGLVKGNLRLKLEIGDKCTPVVPGGSPLKMAMISDLSPSDGQSDVSVFTMPQATFTMALGKAFEAEDNQGVGTYRISLKSFQLLDEKGNVINGEYKWNTAKDAVSLKAYEILPPNQPLKAIIEVTFEKFEGGAWKAVVTGGEEAIESRECSFQTSGAPNYIPLDNVLYTYPVVGQKYFLSKEHNNGFVQLAFGQNYLFEKGFDYTLQFADAQKQVTIVPFNYNSGEQRIEFVNPNIKSKESYTIGIYYTPDANTEVSQNSSKPESTTDYSDGGNVTVSNKAASAELNDQQKSILDYSFSTSRFTTFKEKIRSINTEGRGVAEDAGIAFRYLYSVSSQEPFELAEVVGVAKTDDQPLIRATAEMREPFYTNTVMPMVYNGYPYGGVIRLQYRNDSEVGVPPVRSVFVYQPYVDSYLKNEAITNFDFPYSYETSIVYERDFRDLQGLVINNKSKVNNAVYQRFINGRLPFLKKGKYKTTLQYVLPNGVSTSSMDFYFNNFLKLNE